MAKVQTEVIDFARDTSSGALINTNKSAFLAYKQQRQKVTRLDCFEEELEYVRSEIAEVKYLLQKLVGTTNG
jgi:hypothetical protein